MIASVTIFDRSMDPEENHDVWTKSSIGSMNVAAQLTGLLLNEVGMSYTHNCCGLSLVVLTFKLDTVQIGLWRYLLKSLLQPL